jgi:hypothetical protein
MEIEETQGRSQTRNELIFNAIAFPQFIIIFEECFDSDLLFPDFSADASLDAFN